MKKLLFVCIAMIFLGIHTPALAQQCRNNGYGYNNPNYNYNYGYGYNNNYGYNSYPNYGYGVPQQNCVQQYYQPTCQQGSVIISSSIEMYCGRTMRKIVRQEPYQTICSDSYNNTFYCIQYRIITTYENL